ncbi:InlB B-repeat-containing protein [Fannyhessea vaginae]|uniref:InlB B-repeat-containing protein n=1 Tax=Fannyhessea vaginae TaxID=82135 RepID=UPI00336AE607
MKHSKKKSSSLLPVMLSAGVCAVSLGGGIVTSIPTVAYANSVNTQSTPSASSNDTNRGAREQAQSNHAANLSSKSQTAAPSIVAARTVSAEPTPVQPKDDSLTWTKDDFNISADGKMIGGRKNVYHPETGQTVSEYVDGLTAKGKEKLKKNHHVVIPEGIEVIHECAFTGRAKQVGNHHEHIDGETYIEGVTLPQSLRIIEYGAFGWNKIKGTLTIPKNVVSIHNGAFVANEIEKVVFEGVLDDKGKEHDTDTQPYYLAGIGSVAFQGNKISEIVVKDNLSKYKFRSGENDSPFDNQNPGPFTIEVGEEYKTPIKVTQEGSGHTISVMEGFEENGNPVTIDQSPYFKKNADGKYVAVKTGTLEGQCIFYDFVQGAARMIGRSRFTYNIIPKPKIYTVTFVNENNQNYAKVQVKENKSIKDKSVAGQVMPHNPSKAGYTFRGWSTDKTGKDKTKEFSADTPVTGDITVYALYTPTPAVLNAAPSLTVQDKTITEGDPLDLRSLIVSASDAEDGDLKDEVVIADQGGYSNTKPGTYKIVFQVTDKGKACVSKTATVTVNKKAEPVPLPPAPKPNSQPGPQHLGKHTPQHVLPKTGDVSSLGMLVTLLGASCAILGTLGKKSVQKCK